MYLSFSLLFILLVFYLTNSSLPWDHKYIFSHFAFQLLLEGKLLFALLEGKYSLLLFALLEGNYYLPSNYYSFPFTFKSFMHIKVFYFWKKSFIFIIDNTMSFYIFAWITNCSKTIYLFIHPFSIEAKLILFSIMSLHTFGVYFSSLGSFPRSFYS